MNNLLQKHNIVDKVNDELLLLDAVDSEFPDKNYEE